MDTEQISKIVRHIASRFPGKERQRSIFGIAKQFGRWVGVITIVSGTVSFAIEGKELFAKKIPMLIAFVSKELLLGGTLRPYLVEYIAEEYLGYTNICVESSQKLDFDGDGDTTDLLFGLYPKNELNKCSPDDSRGSIYAILKESGWKGVWPEYTLIRFITQGTGLPWNKGTGFPGRMVFEEKGPFLVGYMLSTRSPRIEIYGYFNGNLHSFGPFLPKAAPAEAKNYEEPIMQIGSRLFFDSAEGMIVLEILYDGQFSKRTMLANEIVERNNTVLMLEYFSELPNNVTSGDVEASLDIPKYETSSETDKLCLNDNIFMNGVQVPLKQSKRNNEIICSGKIGVSPIDVIFSNVYCDFQGFRKIRQFPWGYVLDTNQITHTIKCPYSLSDFDEPSYSVELLVSY